MLILCSQTLSAAGYEHYEVSSYGRVPPDVTSDMTSDEIHERAVRLCLAEWIYELVLESQLPHKIVNLLFTINN